DDKSAKEPRLTVSIYDRDGNEVHVFDKHTMPIRGGFFSPDGRLIISRGGLDEIMIWETATGTVRWSCKPTADANTPQRPLFPQFSPDGRYLAVPEPEEVKVLTVADWQERFSLGKAT